MSGVSRAAEETCRARGIPEAAIAEAKSVHGEVESRVASLAAQAESSTVHITDALSKRMGEVAAKTEAETLCAIGTTAQQLEKEIEAAAVSTAMMSDQRTHSVVEGLRTKIQAQISQNQADFERC